MRYAKWSLRIKNNVNWLYSDLLHFDDIDEIILWIPFIITDVPKIIETNSNPNNVDPNIMPPVTTDMIPVPIIIYRLNLFLLESLKPKMILEIPTINKENAISIITNDIVIPGYAIASIDKIIAIIPRPIFVILERLSIQYAIIPIPSLSIPEIIRVITSNKTRDLEACIGLVRIRPEFITNITPKINWNIFNTYGFPRCSSFIVFVS